MGGLVELASAAFESYLRSLGEKQFEQAAQPLGSLQQTLQQLSRQAEATGPQENVEGKKAGEK